MRRLGTGLAAGLILGGCAFNFEVTSQRTALENQVMGAYKEMEDDLVLIAAVRKKSGKAPLQSLSEPKREALIAKANQDFNRDDVDELKEAGLLGETADGRLALLTVNPDMPADRSKRALASSLVEEENADRLVIWRRIISSNENLSDKDLPEVRRTYARMIRDSAPDSHWFQNEAGKWLKKSSF